METTVWLAKNEGLGPAWFEQTHTLTSLGPHDLLVEVKAVSVNPVDTKLFAALKPGQQKVLGYDAAGVVVSVGDQVTAFKPGDEVFYAGDVTRDGSFSQHQLVDSRLVARKPCRLSFTAAAALPLVSLTAVESLFEHLQLPFAPPTERTLLIINGAGGVGSMAIQLAKLAGVKVIATASREESKAWCRQLGADEVIDHSAVAEVEADWILNAAPKLDDYITPMARSVKPFGRVCALASAKAPIDMNLFKDKSVGFEWTFMFTRAKYNVAPERQGEWLARIARWVDAERLQAIDRAHWEKLSISSLQQAFEAVSQGGMVGKAVLSVGSK
jgi:zinc-binding alcohol dehydrogenase family protein